MVKLQYKHDSIRSLRTAHNLEIEAFAARVGVERQHVYKWEDGKTIPTVISLCKIANAFSFRNLDYFFAFDDYNGGKNGDNGNHTT